MNSAALIEQRVAITCSRHPAFPGDVALIFRMMRQITRNVTAHANGTHAHMGISYPEYIILMSLHGTQTCTLSAAVLRNVSGGKAGNLTRLAEQPCTKGFIVRGLPRQDRRKTTYRLTLEGMQLIDAFLPVVSALLGCWPPLLAQAEFKELERMLRRILRESEA